MPLKSKEMEMQAGLKQSLLCSRLKKEMIICYPHIPHVFLKNPMDIL